MNQTECEALLTPEFFSKHYVSERKSYPALKQMLADQGRQVSVACIHKYAKKLGFGRTVSEGRRNLDPNPLDYRVSFLSENLLETVDGLLLGDGSISAEHKSIVPVARFTWNLEHVEFANWFATLFSVYKPSVASYHQSSMKSGVVQQGRTKTHPDIYAQYSRWYANGSKQPPDDVRLTPRSVMMWYLGDGSLVSKDTTVMLRLSTDGFAPERVEFLAQRLNKLGIQCHRNCDNRIQIDARGIPTFFDFIGRKSPVECYQYKFKMPAWRFEAKRMREVAGELGICYHQLAYLVKIGKIPCMRLSPKGKPRFMPEHIEAANRLILKENV